MECFCDPDDGSPAARAAAKLVDGGQVALADGRMWVVPKKTTGIHMHGFAGFYVRYPDDERTPPRPLGLVSTISEEPPVLNWIYIIKGTGEVRFGNRTESREHTVGEWGWDDGSEEEGDGEGGLTLDGQEGFVVVEGRRGGDKEGLWEVRWDERDNGLKGVAGIKGRRVLRVSLEKRFLDEEEGSKGE